MQSSTFYRTFGESEKKIHEATDPSNVPCHCCPDKMRFFPKAKTLGSLHSEQQDHENGHHHHDNHGIVVACAAAAAPEQDYTGTEEEDDYDSDVE
jgi:hypothetical protein